MTLGDGIFRATVVIVLAGAVYQISVREKWTLVGKIVGVLILTGAIIGGGVWGWFSYRDRPYVVEEFAGIRLGMRPVDVTIAKGEASGEQDLSEGENKEKLRVVWIYRSDDSGPTVFVIFDGSKREEMVVTRICQRKGYRNLLGVDMYMSEKEVVQELGESSHERINDNQLSKWLSYERWNVAYLVQAGKVDTMCVTGRPFAPVLGESPSSDATGEP
ncbi:MAG: hypothetical protein WD672_14035 [Woeseia sp.]